MLEEKIVELTKEIDLIMDEWLTKHNFTARSGGLYSEFCWRYDLNSENSDEIRYTLLIDKDNDEAFDRIFYEELGCNYDVGTFWVSWFHEIGHSQTYKLVPNYFWWNVPGNLIEYIHCPREITASQWAVDYINANIEDVKELAQKVDKLRQQIYSL